MDSPLMNPSTAQLQIDGHIWIGNTSRSITCYDNTINDLKEAIKNKYPNLYGYRCCDQHNNVLEDGNTLENGFNVKLDIEWLPPEKYIPRNDFTTDNSCFTIVKCEDIFYDVFITGATTPRHIINLITFINRNRNEYKSFGLMNYFRGSNNDVRSRKIEDKKLDSPIRYTTVYATQNIIYEICHENEAYLPIPGIKKEQEYIQVSEYNVNYYRRNVR